MLACINTINRPRQSTRVMNDTKLSANIRKAMLVHNNLQPHVAVLDNKNIDIPGKKRPHQLLIQKIQYEHKSKFDGQLIDNLVWVIQPRKPELNYTHEKKREEFCD